MTTKLTYRAYYGGKQIEFQSTSMLTAFNHAMSEMRVPKSKRGLLSVVLVAKNDQAVIHSTNEL